MTVRRTQAVRTNINATFVKKGGVNPGDTGPKPLVKPPGQAPKPSNQNQGGKK